MRKIEMKKTTLKQIDSAIEQLNNLREHCNEMAEELNKPKKQKDNIWADDAKALSLAISALYKLRDG